MVKTSVIIPCWITDNTLLHLTHRCLETVRETSKVELIVVDNASTQGQHMMMEYADVYVRNTKNLGFTRAINQGVVLSTKEYIVIGNNDYFVEPGWEKVLIDTLNENSKYMTVTPHTGGKIPEYDTDYRDWETDRKSTRLNSSHRSLSRMPSSA